jgi:signal transduction histidine kinase
VIGLVRRALAATDVACAVVAVDMLVRLRHRTERTLPTAQWVGLLGVTVTALAATMLVASLGRPTRGLGVLAIAAVSPWWSAYSVGHVLQIICASTAFATPVIVATLLNAGRVRWLAASAASAAIVHVLFLDPHLVIDCTPVCTPNPFVVDHLPIVVKWWTAGWVVAIIWYLVASTSNRSRGVQWIAVAATACVFLPPGVGAGRVAFDSSWASTRWLMAVAGALVAVCVATFVAATEFTVGRRIRRFELELAETCSPGGVEAMLQRALDDPALAVRYWVEGQPTGAPPQIGAELPHRSIHRSGNPVAEIFTSNLSALDAALSPAVVVALENERLAVTAQALLDAARDARSRELDAADQRRKQLERDVHDGAQQRLLSVSIALSARPDRDDRTRRAISHAANALDELRRIAHGLYPVVLDELGLAEAIYTFMEDSPVALAFVDELSPVRPPLHIERLLYRAVVAATQLAADSDPRSLRVRLLTDGPNFVLEFVHGGQPWPDLGDLRDRVGALNGSITMLPVDGMQQVRLVVG